MPIYEFEGLTPVVAQDAFVHPTAVLIGDVGPRLRGFTHSVPTTEDFFVIRTVLAGLGLFLAVLYAVVCNATLPAPRRWRRNHLHTLRHWRRTWPIRSGSR